MLIVIIYTAEWLHLPLLQDDTQEVGAFFGDGLELLWEVGGLEAGVEGFEVCCLAELVGLGGVVLELGGDGILEEQVALGHVLAEVALHDAGVDEGFE